MQMLSERTDQHFRKRITLMLILGVLSACATSGGLFTAGPRPPELVGTWVDVGKATTTDTVAWVLAPNGADRTLAITVLPGEHGKPTRHETVATHGTWYGSGQLADTVRRQLCFKHRARTGPTCFAFRLDTLAMGPVRRRLTVLQYHSTHSTGDRVLLERNP